MNKSVGVKWPEISNDNHVDDPVLAVAEGRHFKTSSFLCRKKAFLKVGFFNEELTAGEDEDWFSRAAQCLRFKYLPESYLKVRFHSGQTGLSSERSVRSLIRVFEGIKSRTKGVHLSACKAAGKRLASKVSELANLTARRGLNREGALWAFKSYLMGPSHFLRLLKAGLFLAGWKPKNIT
jgi:hypothetical protein